MKWYNNEVEEIIKHLKTDTEKGLIDQEVSQRQQEKGFNELEQREKESILIKFLKQFKDFMIIILIIAAIVSGIVGIYEGEGITDTVIILIVVVLNAIIGVSQELKAEKSLEALQKLSAHETNVLRNGETKKIPSRELVPGDIVILETGNSASADMRLIEAVNLKAEEASLTGESLPATKNTKTIKEDKISIGDKKNIIHSSSVITYGRGKAIVVETGMTTEVGKIAKMINNTDQEITPLQQKLNKLGKTLGIVAISICVVMYFIGLLNGHEPLNMFMTAVSLAVAAIPEGLAAVSTIVLAIGVQKMSKRNAIIKKLPSVETLGSTSIICSDKTGTLTQNKMTVQNIYHNQKLTSVNLKTKTNDLETLLNIFTLCNDTIINDDSTLAGDPTETSLIDLAFKLDYPIKEYQRVKEIPFDSKRKLMTTVNKINDKYFVYTKGGLDELLSITTKIEINNRSKTINKDDIEDIKQTNEKMASNALRVLAAGYKILDHEPTEKEMKTLESDLIFVGLVGMIDPPRPEVKLAVKKCRSAGIKPIMITGDHKITAMAIAKELGILKKETEAISGTEIEAMTDKELEKNITKYSVYARVSPEHKVRIVTAWQKRGDIVAMTGDGVNDAPALKKSNIGCAMGITGTDVAKETADVILTDDNFSTIVVAVEEGRRIYDNILKAIVFLLSSNVGEIVVLLLSIVLTPVIADYFLIPDQYVSHLTVLLPIQIIFINLITDSIPALTLAVDPGEDDIMDRKTNQNKNIFTKGIVYRILYQGIVIGLITLVAFFLGLSTPDVTVLERITIGETMAFIVLATSQLVHIFNIRNPKKSIFKSNPFNNKLLLIAVIASFGIILLITNIPFFKEIFNITYLSFNHVIQVIGLSLMPLLIVEEFKLFKINTFKDE